MTLPTSIVSGKVWSEQWLFSESTINKGVSTSVGVGVGTWGGKPGTQAIFSNLSQIANHLQLQRHITCKKQRRIVSLRLLLPLAGSKQLINP